MSNCPKPGRDKRRFRHAGPVCSGHVTLSAVRGPGTNCELIRRKPGNATIAIRPVCHGEHVVNRCEAHRLGRREYQARIPVMHVGVGDKLSKFPSRTQLIGLACGKQPPPEQVRSGDRPRLPHPAIERMAESPRSEVT